MSRHPVGHTLVLSVVIGMLISGCAWRTADTLHHVGPVLFRFHPPDASTGGISDLVHIGPFIEGGEQWGMSLGVTERIAVAPSFPGSTAAPAGTAMAESPVRWPAFDALEPGRWHLSLLYLRIRAASAPALVLRQIYGLELTIGSEARAASLGWTSRMLINLPDDALSVARFDRHRPLTSVFVSWPAATLDAAAAWKTFQEGTP
jgi:hypothetical protein